MKTIMISDEAYYKILPMLAVVGETSVVAQPSIKLSEASEKYNVSYSTLRRWISRKSLAYSQPSGPGGIVYLTEADVMMCKSNAGKPLKKERRYSRKAEKKRRIHV